jgi:hypothetical protein
MFDKLMSGFKRQRQFGHFIVFIPQIKNIKQMR